MTNNLQGKFYMCAFELIAYIPNHSTRLLQDNSWTERSGLKIIAHFTAECRFDVSKVGDEGTVFLLIVHLFVSYAHVNPYRFLSSSWCQVLAATSAYGSSWTFLFTFFLVNNHPVTPKFTQKLVSSLLWVSISCLRLSCVIAKGAKLNMKQFTLLNYWNFVLR